MMAEVVARGHMQPSAAADLLHEACTACSLYADVGADRVQDVIGRAWREAEQQTLEEIAAQPRDPWTDPDTTLLEDGRGPLPPFPVATMPPAWRPWLERAARGAGVMSDHVAMPLLAIVSGLIGAARRIRASRSWSEPLCLWTAVVGLSGTGKTPGQQVITRELSRIERGRAASIEEARAQHDTRTAAAKSALRAWRRDVDEALKAGRPAPERPTDAAIPAPFVSPRFCVSDATVERVATLIEARPRGLAVVQDELAALFLNMQRYNRGSDREFWLQAWTGLPYVIERQTRPPISLRHLLVAITGGFQPSKLARAFAGDDDGMYARILYAWPAEPPYRPLADDVDEVDADLLDALMKLVDLPAGQGTDLEPRYLPLSDDARARFERFRHEVMTVGRASLDGREREWWAKGPGQVLRLAGVLAYLDWAMPGRSAADSGHPALSAAAWRAQEPTEVGEEIMNNGITL